MTLCFTVLGETEDWRDFFVYFFGPLRVFCPPPHLWWAIFGNQDPISHKEQKHKGVTSPIRRTG